MNLQEAKILIEKYLEGDTNSAEERKLKSFFLNEEFPQELEVYASLFKGLDNIQQTNGNTESDFIDASQFMDIEIKEKESPKERSRQFMKIAATIIVIIASYFAFDILVDSGYKKVEDTFQNPEDAYAYFINTLDKVSGTVNSGMESADDLTVLSDGLEFQKELEDIEQEIEELNPFKLINKALEDAGKISRLQKVNN